MFPRAVTILALIAGAALAAITPAVAQQQTAGMSHRTLISYGDAYTSAEELYDVAITIQQVLQGDTAWSRVSSADPDAVPPPSDKQYLLVRLKFDYAARSTPGDKPYQLAQNQFRLVSAQGQEIASLDAIALQPGLNGLVRAPGSTAGWVAFLIDRAARYPQLVFYEEVGNTMLRGSGFRVPLD